MSWLGALATIALFVVACVVPNARARASPDAGTIVAVIPVGAGPTAGLAADDTAVWVPSDFDSSLSRVDPLTNQLAATIRVGPSPSCSFCLSGVALHEGAVWATSSSARLALVGIDSLTNRVTDTVAVPVFPSAVVSANDGTLWLASMLDNAVVRIDPVTRQVIARIPVARPARLAAGDDAVWATSRADGVRSGAVVRIDRLTNHIVATVAVGAQPVAIASGEGSIWVVDDGRQSLERVDPRSNTVVASIPVGVLPSGVVAGGGSVWVISHSAPTVKGAAVLRIDPIAEAVTGSIALGEGTPVGLTMGAGSLWVASRNPDTVLRVDPFPSQSPEANGAPLAMLVLLAVAALYAARAWRGSFKTSDAAPAQSAGQMADLRRFASSHPRVRSPHDSAG